MARPYKNGSYIYPPRPEHRVKPESLDKYDTGEYIAQSKLNGSNCTIYMDGKTFYQRNRHKGEITNFKMKSEDILSLHRGVGDMVIVGEYMNKSQTNKEGKVFNNKFVIFDILVYEGQHLVGSTFDERFNLLVDLFGGTEYDDYLYYINDNVFMVKSFEYDFNKLYNDIVKIGMLEGLVLKPKFLKLDRGTKEKNTLCLKCRKETKNYQF